MPTGTKIPKVRRVGVVFGEPLDFSRFDGMEGDRFVLRSITDEIMYELSQLSGQEYVDVYASSIKREKPREEAPPQPRKRPRAGGSNSLTRADRLRGWGSRADSTAPPEELPVVDPSETVVQADPAVIAGLDYWRELPIKQQPVWPDADAAAAASKEISTLPPLVFAGEVDILRERLARAARGESFLLQGGDCAETFAGATAEQIRNRVKTLLQMAVVLTYGASMPVVKMGRMAGQFAKPRSNESETRGDLTLPAYRGDIVNGYDFTPESRAADPRRLVQGYHTAASTLNLIRAFTQGGFADLRQVHSWNHGLRPNPQNQQYEGLAREIDRAVKFMEAAGADFDELKRVEFYTSTRACSWTTSAR